MKSQKSIIYCFMWYKMELKKNTIVGQLKQCATK